MYQCRWVAWESKDLEWGIIVVFDITTPAWLILYFSCYDHIMAEVNKQNLLPPAETTVAHCYLIWSFLQTEKISVFVLSVTAGSSAACALRSVFSLQHHLPICSSTLEQKWIKYWRLKRKPNIEIFFVLKVVGVKYSKHLNIKLYWGLN